MQPNGHKLKRIEGTDTGWMRCTECGRTAGGTSDEYWTRVSCNKNQCATDDYWCRKRYTNKDAESRRRNRRLEKMLAIRDKTTNEARNLTECEADRVADSKSEARHRRILKQKMEESRSKASEVREFRRENKEKEQEQIGKERRKGDEEVGEQREPTAKRARCTAEETEGRSGSYANEAAASRQSDTKLTQNGEEQQNHKCRHRTSLDDDQIQDDDEPRWDADIKEQRDTEPPTLEEETEAGEPGVRAAEEASESERTPEEVAERRWVMCGGSIKYEE